MSTEWIAPTITGLFGVILIIVTAVLARRGARLGNREQRMPDVQELWIQQEADRRMRQVVEDLWWDVRQAFHAYYHRINISVRMLDLSPEQRADFELSAQERAAIQSKLPKEPPTPATGK